MQKRYSIFPIQHQDLWERYQAALSQFWVTEEVDLSQDKWDELTDKEQGVLEQCLGFFAASDIIVNENIATTLLDKVNETEAEFYYHLQLAIEDIHSHLYGLFIETYIDSDKRNDLYLAAERMETVKHKTDWAFKWLASESFEESMVAFSVIEGLLFQGLFSIIFYFKDGGKLPGLCQGNLFISKDENNHYEFAVNYFNNYTNGLKPERVREIIIEGYEVEKKFVEEVLGDGLPGLLPETMVQYIQYVTDTVLQDYSLPKEFNVSNPLLYMKKIALETRSNFFEVRSTDYTRVKQSEVLFDNDF